MQKLFETGKVLRVEVPLDDRDVWKGGTPSPKEDGNQCARVFEVVRISLQQNSQILLLSAKRRGLVHYWHRSAGGILQWWFVVATIVRGGVRARVRRTPDQAAKFAPPTPQSFRLR